MSLPVLALMANSDGYQVLTGKSTLGVQLDGGMGRYRKDQLGASSTVQVTYTLSNNGYNYLLAFYRTTLEEGSAPFQAGLLFETADVTQYCCHIIPGTFSLPRIQGLTYTVTMNLEVTSISPPASTADLALVLAYDTYGENTNSVLNQLAYLVNVQMNF